MRKQQLFFKLHQYAKTIENLNLIEESLKTGTGFSQPQVHTVMGKDECPQGTSPTHNCMNEWLGEPVLVSQLPGRGILRIYINNLAIKGVFVEKIVCILNISWENKKVPMVCH